MGLEPGENDTSPDVAVSPAVTPAEVTQLAELILLWPTLSDAMRQAILMMARDTSRPS